MRVRIDDGKGAGHTAPAPPMATPTTPAAPSSRAPAPKPTHTTQKPVLAPGARSERVRELQARLRQLKYFGRNPTGYYGSVTAAAVTAFQRDQGLPRTGTVDAATLSALRVRTQRPTRDELYPPTARPVAAPDKRCLTGRAICISKKSDTLAWMVDGKVVSAMDVRFGSQYSPTREGTFGITFKSRHHVSTIYDTPMPYAMFFSGGQAIHYSADFAARGYAGASHGCVNVRDKKKIAALFQQVKPGTKVVIYK
nr:L,D-transpeptidase family protein [Streptomyces ochraceiscleroticus]